MSDEKPPERRRAGAPTQVPPPVTTDPSAKSQRRLLHEQKLTALIPLLNDIELEALLTAAEKATAGR